MSCLPGMNCYGNDVIVYTTYPTGCSPSTSTSCLESGKVCYSGPNLPNSGINDGDTLTLALQKIDNFLNTEVNILAGEGIEVTGIYPEFTITNTAQESLFQSDVTFTLEAGESFGKYQNGDTAPWTGLSALEAILDAAVAYISPVFNSFSVATSSTVEVGTTLSGAKTFAWSISANSGIVTTINLYDVTAGVTLLAGTPNDGGQSQAITTIQLNANGSTQQWRGVGNNTSPVSTFNSSPYTVTSRFYRFFGPVATVPVDSPTVRALPSSVFQTSGANFTLNTGTVETKFVVALPPSVTINSVFDLDALNANITANYVSTGSINVLDAGGIDRSYTIYVMTLGAPYASNHRHSITTS